MHYDSKKCVYVCACVHKMKKNSEEISEGTSGHYVHDCVYIATFAAAAAIGMID